MIGPHVHMGPIKIQGSVPKFVNIKRLISHGAAPLKCLVPLPLEVLGLILRTLICPTRLLRSPTF